MLCHLCLSLFLSRTLSLSLPIFCSSLPLFLSLSLSLSRPLPSLSLSLCLSPRRPISLQFFIPRTMLAFAKRCSGCDGKAVRKPAVCENRTGARDDLQDLVMKCDEQLVSQRVTPFWSGVRLERRKVDRFPAPESGSLKAPKN